MRKSKEELQKEAERWETPAEGLAYVVGYLEAIGEETPKEAKLMVRRRLKEKEIGDAYQVGLKEGLTDQLNEAVARGYPRKEVDHWVQVTREERLSYEEFRLLLNFKLNPALAEKHREEIELILAKLNRIAAA